jgi:predicted AAA+ superfamily ATPase
MLSSEIATKLRGRAFPVEVFPFSFSEYLAHKHIEHTHEQNPPAEVRSRLMHELRNYLMRGGFPEVVNCDTVIAREILQGYVDTVILRDIVERHNITAIVALRHLVSQILANPAAAQSIHKIYSDFRSRGISVSKDTLYAMASHLEDAYLFQAAEIHSSSVRVRQSHPRKIYPIDCGLAVAYSKTSQQDLGKLLETATFLCLRRFCKNIDFYRTKDAHEVDFILNNKEFDSVLIQSCARMDDENTREREIRAISAAMKEVGSPHGWIVTLDQEEHIKVGAGSIHVVPAWKFFLNAKDKILEKM